MATKKSAAKVLHPGTEVEVGGEHLRVLPLTLDQIFENIELLDEIAKEIKTITPVKILQAHKKDIYRVIAGVIGKDEDFVGALSANDAFTVVEAFIEENGSFFIGRLLPTIQALFPEVENQLGGAPSSPNLEILDTVGQTAES